MRYKIKDISSEGLLVQEPLPRALLADALDGMDADLQATTGNLRVELTKDRDDNVFARGDLKALLTLPCASCLGPTLVKIDSLIKMTFVSEDNIGDDDDAADDAFDDLEIGSHDGVTVDLEMVVREQIILGLPMSPRCRDNCLGLCPVCGQNRNQTDCGHKPEAKISALSAQLQQVKEKLPKARK